MTRLWSTFLAAAVLATPVAARGQSFRLRADALASAQAPAGVFSVSADSRLSPWLSAEAVVWTASSEDVGGEADVLTALIRARAPNGLGELRIGRQIIATGAIRPVHADALSGILRLPFGMAFEAFAGLSVTPRLGERSGDWLAGGRVSQDLFGLATVGASFVHGQEDGLLANREIGADFVVTPAGWLDFGARAAWDLITSGVTEAHATAAARLGQLRFEAYASHRDVTRLLPATSLFSVLGASNSESLGAEVFWRAAPRLDVSLRGGARVIGAVGEGGEVSEELRLRSTLRLDDKGEGSLGIEARRQGSERGPWNGVRLTVRVPIGESWVASSELEVVVPDEDDGRGAVWPWGLVAVGWRPSSSWELAAAAEARATPEFGSAYDVLLRARYLWSAP